MKGLELIALGFYGQSFTLIIKSSLHTSPSCTSDWKWKFCHWGPSPTLCWFSRSSAANSNTLADVKERTVWFAKGKQMKTHKDQELISSLKHCPSLFYSRQEFNAWHAYSLTWDSLIGCAHGLQGTGYCHWVCFTGRVHLEPCIYYRLYIKMLAHLEPEPAVNCDVSPKHQHNENYLQWQEQQECVINEQMDKEAWLTYLWA